MRAYVALGLLLLLQLQYNHAERASLFSLDRPAAARSQPMPFRIPPAPTITTTTISTTTEKPKLPATYWVTFSTKMRPGMTLPVTVHLVNAGDVANVSVSLRNSSDESIVFAEAPTETVSGGAGSHIINLEVPRNLRAWRYKRGGWFQYLVRVVATGDVSFNQSKTVSFSDKAFSIFVQTDKAVYKPGQTVKFRALAMNPDLTVLTEPMDILIRDPLGNGIKRWRNVQGFENTGVVERSMPTSRNPPLGDWTIDVTVLGQTESKTFSIDKYVLPKFEATLDVPKVVVTSEPALRGKAMAKYTFGKPLTDAEVLVTVKFSYYYDRYGNKTQPTLQKRGTLNRDGEFEFLFYKNELLELTWQNNFNYRGARRDHLRLAWQQFQVIANVTDVRTGHKMGAVSKVRFVDRPAKMEFLSISPNTYKPGLKYTAHLSVTKQDDSLFENYNSINVTFNVTISVPKATTTTTTTTTASPTSMAKVPLTKKLMEVMPTPGLRIPPGRRPWLPYYRPQETVVLTTVNMTLTANGFLSLELHVPSVALSVDIEATTMGVTAYKRVQKAASASGNYLQIQAKTDRPKVGQQVMFDVKTTEPVDVVIYQLYAKGIMLNESVAQAADAQRQTFTVSFPAVGTMAPNSRILVFYFRSDGEVVADSLSFKVDPSSENQVDVTYNRQKVKPGEDVLMTVTARPSSVVFLLGIDKSVKLLKSGNDITREMVDEQLVQYDFGSGYGGFWRYMVICGWPWPSQGVDANGVFNGANVAMFTDGDLYQKPFTGRTVSRRLYNSGNPSPANSPGPSIAASSVNDVDDDWTAVEKVRSFFPETWLFATALIGSEGRSVMKKTAPDTITTWLTSAFSIHPQFGLSVIQKPAELTTFRDVFVSLDLPYSAIRGEDLCMKAFAYNYYNRPLYMRLVMGRSEGTSNIRLIRTFRRSKKRIEYRIPMKVTHRIGKVKPNEIRDTTFCFTPNTLGYVPIRVNLTTTSIPGDAVERMLLVEPEGVPRVQTVPVILDVNSTEPFLHVQPIVFPDDAVAGSQRITVSVAGDLLDSVVANLDDLLRMPYGCGEQNMLYFAPNVFLIDYLQRTDTYTPEVAEKAENYMLVGYQKEIKYQHDDGSYSAFGQRDDNQSGSMWLTAFVTKCFVQSMALKGDVVNVEPRLVRRSIEWMTSMQGPDGSFPEPGKVFNKNMQGGSAKGEALTAYVLIALAEADKNFEGLNLQQAIALGRNYLEQQLPTLNDSYDIAIVTYALHLTESSLASEAFDRLMSKAISKSLTLHWERPKSNARPAHYRWQRQTDAINIEMTAYAMLTFLLKKDVAKAVPIVRWLTSQRGPQGGFISTQDTVVGLQALSQIAAKIYQPHFTPITVTVDWSVEGRHESRTVTLNDTSRLLLQKIAVPIERNLIPSDVRIHASALVPGNFSGMAVAEVTLDYNVLEPTTFTTFSLVPEVRVTDPDNFVLQVTAARVDGQTGSMTVMEVGVPTGYSVDESSPMWDVGGAMMAEPEGRKYVLYFEEMGPTPVVVTLPMTVSNGIPVNTQPTAVLIYDYYESGGDQQMSVNYKLPKVDFICNRQPKYESCPFIKG